MEEYSAVYVGIDLGDRTSRVCVLAEGGEVVEESQVRTTPEGMRRFFGRPETMRVALEVGTHSPWVSGLMEELGHEVWVANPRQLPLISQSTRKNDRADAETLARLLRADPKLLRPIQPRPQETLRELGLVRGRATLVRARTALVNALRGTAKSAGVRLPECSTARFARAAREAVEPLGPGAMAMLTAVGALTEQIGACDREVEGACERYPETAVLRKVPGVGSVTALTYVLTVGDPKRFRSSREVGSYLGMRPKQDQSGKQDRQLRISKEGDGYLRQLLVGSAQYVLGPFGPDSDLKRWGKKLAERGGGNGKKRAVVAVARKLSVLLHALWKTGEVYEPLRQARARGEWVEEEVAVVVEGDPSVVEEGAV